MNLRFLGTCGGRYATGEQARATGGIIMETDEQTRIHVDPGPGALVHTHEYMDDPMETDSVIVSHGHLDHANDAEAIIEMMTEAAHKPGNLFASSSVLEGHGDMEKAVSDYHKDLCSRIVDMNQEREFGFKYAEIRTQEMFHSDPRTVGFTVETDEKKVGFWTDTEFSEELLDFYDGCDWMIVYCTRPRNSGVPQHTSLDEVPRIVEEVDPGTVFITHFGKKFLESDMEAEKSWLEDQVDAKVVFAEDGMEFPGERPLDSFS